MLVSPFFDRPSKMLINFLSHILYLENPSKTTKKYVGHKLLDPQKIFNGGGGGEHHDGQNGQVL
jgi:hypothetical protein